jgi:hypothetical protein
MKTIDLPYGGKAIAFGTEAEIAEHERIISARAAFSKAYAEARGWPTDPGMMTWEQIFEIRSQEGWVRP